MEPILIAVLSILAIGIAIWLIGMFLICPGPKREGIEKYKSVKFAHRGLHDSVKAENSMSAFAAAKENGFGIELDVRLSKDGELMVYHDDDLSRIVGIEGKFSDFTYAELSEMNLLETDDKIPTFKEVLDLIDGAVPLLVELKVASGERGVAKKFVEVIEGYKGDFIVESFNPFALRELRALRPDIIRGILSTEYMKSPKHKGKTLFRMLQNLQFNFLMRPDFIAYEKNGSGVRNLRRIRRSFETTLIAWTIKSQEEEDAALNSGFDTVIFEGYIPQSKRSL